MELPANLVDHLEQIIENPISQPDVIKRATTWLDSLNSPGPKVCQLQKALYGLRQAGHQWYMRLDQELSAMGFKSLKTDPCLYVLKKGKTLVLLAIYVDDILLAANDTAELENVKTMLKTSFKISDFGEAKFCLGIEINHDKARKSITLTQTKYINDVLDRFGMKDCKPVSTPMDPNHKLLLPEKPNAEEMKRLPYQKLIGSLMYLAVSTRPDISYAVSALSQFNCNYTNEHFVAAKRVLRYLKGTPTLGLCYQDGNLKIQGFVDADWAGCQVDRKSYTGFVFSLDNSVISWEAKKQQTVALSSTEAEFVALSEATKEALYLKCLLNELLDIDPGPVDLYNDNQSAGQLAKNHVFHSRTKHIDIRHHFIRDAIANGDVKVFYQPTEQMPADVLTKALNGPKHLYCVENMDMATVNILPNN
ncbi:hypothetical protein CHUAL_014034 [Chamberlinius hualienensis]